MNEEIMTNDVTMETTTQETAPAETDGATLGSMAAGLAVYVGTAFLTTFAAMAGMRAGVELFRSDEEKAKRRAEKEARKAERLAKKALKKAKKARIVEEVEPEEPTEN